MKNTKLGNSYWNDSGAYTKEYEKLYKDLVPSMGEAETLNGELIRAISRLGYEYNNNGNCNASVIETRMEEYDCYCGGNDDSCMDCYGMGFYEEEEYEEPYVDTLYSSFLELIEKTVPNTKKECADVMNLIIKDNYSFSDEEENTYDKLFDKVIFYVLNNEDTEIPEWYLLEMENV